MTQRTCATTPVRRFAVGSATVVAAGILLAGGGAGGDPPPPPDPKDTLLSAVPNETTPAFRFTGTDASGTVTGSVDPAGKGMELTVVQQDAEAEFALTISFRVVDQRSWMRVDFEDAVELSTLLELPRQWMELDQSKLTKPEVYGGADVGNAAAIIRTAVAVQQQTDGSYAGTVDLTGGPEVAEAVDGVDVTAMGEAATAIPFTAVVGANGNLGTLALDLPAVGEQQAVEYVVRYYDHGNTPAVAPPTGDVAPAPAAAYDLLNG